MKNKSLKEVLSPLPKISLSLLSSDLSDLKNTVRKIEKVGINILHLDVMDGNFVPNLTYGAPLIKCLRKHTNSFFDVHLMIKNPLKFYEFYVQAGANLIIFHYEAVNTKDIKKLILNIKKEKVFCGISVKPSTSVEKLKPYLNIIDCVLVMTVEPGFGGQKMLKKCLEKVKWLSEYRRKNKLNFLIFCDGGINKDNIKIIVELGCDVPVVGNAIFNGGDFVENAKYFYMLTKKPKILYS